MNAHLAQREAAERALYHVLRGCRIPAPKSPAEKRAEWLQSLTPGDAVRYVMPGVSTPSQMQASVMIKSVGREAIGLSNGYHIDRSTGVDLSNPNAGIAPA